ncbi:MAG: hypothetical protein B7Z58_05435 [Acidiphilium sp. 37-64-53]|nr:MAG: hypothetical protein B7Z58_05435 [Acidiphilium sp. 37-64-53]OZB30494.1 MAG: hypothetical protein B7X49_02565 [Acidiphilium sp. 34-64-41]
MDFLPRYSWGGPSHTQSLGFAYVAQGNGPAISSSGFYIVDAGFNVIKVPEPSSIVLLGTAIIALLGLQATRRHQRRG